ncbi:MAG: tetratricopeptide repeat protein [Anaerolineales bacterium]|jgi:tetratricopeptide (TPR) repeat protein
MGREDLYEESMQLGHSAAWDLDWEKAIEYYRKALAESPDDTIALTNLGLALLETERHKEALASYHKAAKLDPEDPIAVEKCAEIFEYLGQTDEALKQRDDAADRYVRQRNLEKAIENWIHSARLVPGNLAARSRLALTYERLGRRKESIQEYLAVASILQKADKQERATEAVQRALMLIPGDPDGATALRLLRQNKPLPPPSKPRAATPQLRLKQPAGPSQTQADIILQEAQSISQAEDVLQTAPELDDPETLAQNRALTTLASMLFEESSESGGKEGPGLGLFTKSRRSKSEVFASPQKYRYLGEAIDLQTRGHKRRATKVLTRAVDAGLDHPAAHYLLGLLNRDLGNADEARKHLLNSLGSSELALGANLALGRLARDEDNLAEAVQYLLQALRIADSLSVDENQSAQLSELYDTIMASHVEGDKEGLRNIVESTLNFLRGPDWLTRVQQARVQLQSQTDSSSVVPIAEMLAGGGSERIVSSLGHIDKLVSEGRMTTAMEEAMLALRVAPTYLGLHARMAEIMIKSGQVESGLEKMAMIAETHTVRGECKQAAEMFAKIIERSPVDLSARERLIKLLIDQDQTDEALDQYLSLAELHRQMARIDDARSALAKALLLAQQAGVDRSRTMAILHSLSDIDLARLDWRQALEINQQICQLDPDDDKANRTVIDLNLRLGREDQAAKELDGYLDHMVQGGRGTEALNMLEEMTREHPGKQMLHSRLAEAYRAAGRKADAIAQYDALGEIQLDAGQVKEAIRTIRTIVELNPPDAEGYRELLRNLESSSR